MSCYGYSLILPGSVSEKDAFHQMEERGIAIENRFLDRCDRVKTKHEAFDELLKKLQPDDSVFLPSLNCLASSISEVVDAIRAIEEKQAMVVIGDIPVYGEMMGHIGAKNRFSLAELLTYFQETERRLRKNKQRQGIEDAGVRGQKFGRPQASRPKDFVPLVLAYERGEITSAEARKQLGVCEATFFNWLRAYRERK